MISVEQHLQHILGTAPQLSATSVPLAAAQGCVLAEDVTALVPVPPFDNSSMDGYAVQSADVATATTRHPVTLSVQADLPAGTDAMPAVRPGHAVRIMTGAPIPVGADAVVQVEHTDQQPGWNPTAPHTVQVFQPSAPGTFIRRAGSDVTIETLVLPAGRLLGPRDLAAAASVGHGSLPVYPAPRVGVLVTGEEVVAPGSPLAAGQIPDSNGPMLCGLARALGARPLDLGRVGDNRAAFQASLTAALDGVDAVVTVGGISAGAFDVVKASLAGDPGTGSGGITFGKVAMQPGMPQGFGVLTAPDGHRVAVLCLPGNPVSAYVSAIVFLRPMLAVISHRESLDEAARTSSALPQAIADASWHCPANRRQYIPVLVRETDGLPHVRPVTAGGSASHLVASLASGQALAVVGAERDAVEAGDLVHLLELPAGA